MSLTVEVTDAKKHVYLMLYVAENVHPALLKDFYRFHSEKTEKDSVFFALPMAQEWFLSRGYTASIRVSPKHPFYVRWWSHLVLTYLNAMWRAYGLGLFRKNSNDE